MSNLTKLKKMKEPVIFIILLSLSFSAEAQQKTYCQIKEEASFSIFDSLPCHQITIRNVKRDTTYFVYYDEEGRIRQTVYIDLIFGYTFNNTIGGVSSLKYVHKRYSGFDDTKIVGREQKTQGFVWSIPELKK